MLNLKGCKKIAMKHPHRSNHHSGLPLLVLIGILALLLAACAPQSTGTTSTTGAPLQGTLTGDVVAGPSCPVEQAGNPCPPKPVANHDVMVKAENGSVIATAITDAQGHFSISVAPGTYTLDVAPSTGFGLVQKEVVRVTVLAGQTAYVKIELDTGIR
jgi:hypothetical protein